MTLERTGQLAPVVAFTAMGAAADTVAWWRFGDLGPAGKTGLVMQKGYSSSNRLATWDLDEVRITNRVLSPSQFCRAFSGGLKLMFR